MTRGLPERTPEANFAAMPRKTLFMASQPKLNGEELRRRCLITCSMGVNLYTFVGALAPTMAQIGTHNGFWAPTKIIKAPTMALPLGQ